jgi:hypothetical protein
LRTALGRDATDILDGRWVAFGHLTLQVDDPPRWHKDYLAGADLATNQAALKLHHRLEGNADIKLMWEPSRWYSIVRLAQAAYLLDGQGAAAKCKTWLEDWVRHNPPYLGWNWTSALESGLRLVQFVWIDALLSEAGGRGAGLETLRAQVLPPHVWFTWRDRSFGSSANNHLLGELAGLVLALVRWPELEKWSASLSTIQRLWEREILAQFAPDGGNREQALNYQLFSWEFCWQARLALHAAGREIAPAVEDRLRAAVDFFTAIQSPEQQWDYGDSDSAFVTPFFVQWNKATSEWRQWMIEPGSNSAIGYWLGSPPKPAQAAMVTTAAELWRVYPEAGYAVGQEKDWFLRWDLSPLGYLSTAGHGHCDALHLSLWYRGEPIFIDPGTGAYHADRTLRDYLGSWDAHNGPHPPRASFPERRGAFLWAAHHAKPYWEARADGSLLGELRLPNGVMHRSISRLAGDGHDGWEISDAIIPADGTNSEVQVLWQFAPATTVLPLTPSTYRIQRASAALKIEFASGWTTVQFGAPDARTGKSAPFYGVCSPAFRRIETAPFILLHGAAGETATLRTRLWVAE